MGVVGVLFYLRISFNIRNLSSGWVRTSRRSTSQKDHPPIFSCVPDCGSYYDPYSCPLTHPPSSTSYFSSSPSYCLPHSPYFPHSPHSPYPSPSPNSCSRSHPIHTSNSYPSSVLPSSLLLDRLPATFSLIPSSDQSFWLAGCCIACCCFLCFYCSYQIFLMFLYVEDVQVFFRR
jgi:hypothetical protein